MPFSILQAQLLRAKGVMPAGLTTWDWIHAGIILGGSIVVAVVLRRVTLRAFHESERAGVRLLGRFLAYLAVCGGLVYALAALRVQIGPLIGALGIGGIALAFALQDILQNLVAGVILQARRPIRRGDTVEVGSYQGVVRDIDLRTVLVRTFDGLDVYVPNRTVLEGAIVNYSLTPKRRLSINVGVGYGADLEEAQKIIRSALDRVEGVEERPAPAVWVTDFGESTMDFVILVWIQVATANPWEVQHDVAVAVKRDLDAAGIEIPFPQRVVTMVGAPSTPAADGVDGDRRRAPGVTSGSS